MLGELEHDRGQIQVLIGNVDRNDAARPQVALVKLKTFMGQQVDGNGIAAECVEDQQIKLLRRFALKG